MQKAEQRLDVMCYGQICIDHIFHSDQAIQPRLGREMFAKAYTTALGGGAGIVAVTLSRLGLRSGLVSRVGADAPGVGLLAQLRTDGVDVSHVELLRDHATDISVAFTCAKDRGFLSHIAASRVLDHLEMDSSCLAECRHVHLCLSPTEDPAHWSGLLRQAHEVGATVSIDLGWQERWDPDLCTMLGEADIIFPNEPEALRLANTRSLDRALRLLGARGTLVVVKRGSRGVAAYCDGKRRDLPALPVQQVIDPTGAGDMFAAGFLWSHLSGNSLCASLAAGSYCGARCVEQAGGLAPAPRRGELDTVMREFSTTASA
ncbi:MAG: ribokinase [Chloroflexi bacterium]|nr:ribokinase [Chloroflexota bacterium]